MKKQIISVLAALAALPAPHLLAQSGATLFRNALVIDGTGAGPRQADMLVNGERIVQIGKNIRSEGATEINLQGKTIIPSLICAHAHIGTLKGTTSTAENYTRENVLRHLKKYEDYGVGAILVMGTDRPLIFNGLRDSTEAGLLPGARLFSAGYGFNTPDPSPASWMNMLQRPASPDDVPAMLDKVAAVRPTVIKIWVDDHGGGRKMQPEIYKAIISEAHKRNIRVAAHLFYAEDARTLVQAGVDIIAHSIRDKEVDTDLLKAMKQRNIIYIPTLALDQYQVAYAGKPEWMEDDFFKNSLEPGVLDMISDPSYQEKVRNAPEFAANQQAAKTALVNLKKIFDAGILVALGTDSGAFPIRTQGFTEHLEMELMVKAGITPLQALHISTRNAAETLKIGQDYGTLEKGKKADFVILDKNPLENIANTRTIQAVWKDGKEVSKGPLAQ